MRVEFMDFAFPVSSLKEASEVYCAARDKSGLGATRWFEGVVVNDQGTKIARISYNGRVWPYRPWREGMTPLYDNLMLEF